MSEEVSLGMRKMKKGSGTYRLPFLCSRKLCKESCCGFGAAEATVIRKREQLQIAFAWDVWHNCEQFR